MAAGIGSVHRESCVGGCAVVNQLSTHGASSTLQALQVLATTLEILTLLYHYYHKRSVCKA